MSYKETIVVVIKRCSDVHWIGATKQICELQKLLNEVYKIKVNHRMVNNQRVVWFLPNPEATDTISEGLADIARDHDLEYEIIERS